MCRGMQRRFVSLDKKKKKDKKEKNRRGHAQGELETQIESCENSAQTMNVSASLWAEVGYAEGKGEKTGWV